MSRGRGLWASNFGGPENPFRSQGFVHSFGQYFQRRRRDRKPSVRIGDVTAVKLYITNTLVSGDSRVLLGPLSRLSDAHRGGQWREERRQNRERAGYRLHTRSLLFSNAENSIRGRVEQAEVGILSFIPWAATHARLLSQSTCSFWVHR